MLLRAEKVVICRSRVHELLRTQYVWLSMADVEGGGENGNSYLCDTCSLSHLCHVFVLLVESW